MNRPLPEKKSVETLLGADPWVCVLVSDARAGLAAAEHLRGAERRIDGPFAVWDGKAGVVPVSVFSTEPGGAAAWFAATKLAVRRFRPSFVVGVTRIWWIGEGDRPFAVVASRVMDLAPWEASLARVPVTAVKFPGDSPGEAQDREYEWDSLASWEAEETPGLLLAALEEEQEKGIEPVGAGPLESSGNWCTSGRLATWPRDRLECRAVTRWLFESQEIVGVDRESAGLCEAAAECRVPWAILGICEPLDDPREMARQALADRAKTKPVGASTLDVGIARLMNTLSQYRTER
jgi:hypothetical protein